MDTTPLKTLLLDAIRQSGPITFERYMALCLYHPLHGYYMQGRDRTGIEGDFFTSPDLHPIFACLVARQAFEMWTILDRPLRFSWVEMGAGRGFFAHDFLVFVRREFPDFASALDYVVIEAGPKRLARVKERLAGSGLEGTVRFLDNLEQLAPFTGCFFSNELVDAFPVAVVTRAGGCLKEVCVAAEGSELCERLCPIGNPALESYVALYASRLEEGCYVEASLAATQWMRSVAAKLSRGFVLTVDYGDLAGNLCRDDQPGGTLIAYHDHLTSEDFFATPGEVDLTAHVNFSALIDTGKDAGLDLSGFTSQQRFLMALGEGNEFSDLYEQGGSEVENLKARLKLKRLIYPEGMGNIFKVLIQHRGTAPPKLTGLRYGNLNF